MGGKVSRHAEALMNIKKAVKNRGNWESAARQFFEIPWPPGYHLPDKLDGRKIADMMEQQLHNELQSENSHTVMLLLSLIQRLLTNSHVYKAYRKRDLEIFKSCLNMRDDHVFLNALRVFHGLLMADTESEETVEVQAEVRSSFQEANHGFSFLIFKWKDLSQLRRPSQVESLNLLHHMLESLLHQSSSFTPYAAIVEMASEYAQEPNFRSLMALLRHEDPSVRCSAARLLRAVLYVCEEQVLRGMQQSAYAYGDLVSLLSFIVAPPHSPDAATFRSLAMDIFGFFCDRFSPGYALLCHALPEPIARISQHYTPLTVEDEGIRPKASKLSKQEKSMMAQWIRNSGYQHGAWNEMFTALERDWHAPDVIWNQQTRTELQEALMHELHSMAELRDTGVRWQPDEFSVHYPSLDPVLKVDRYYVDILNEHLLDGRGFPLPDPAGLAEELFLASVIEDDQMRKRSILALLATLAAKFSNTHAQHFQPYKHLRYLVWLLKYTHMDRLWIDQVFRMLQALLPALPNKKLFLQEPGAVSLLLHHLTDIHLAEQQEDYMRPADPAAAAPPASPSARDPYLVRGLLLLEIFEELCGSSTVRRILAQPENFQHLCQLVVARDPVVVSKVINILMDVLDVSPQLVPHLYRTGIFTFLMLHTGSEINNVVCSFLLRFHAVQEHDERSTQPLYLRYFFPGPVVAFLSDPDGDRKMAALLREGESQTPDLFWNREMLSRTVRTVQEFLGDFLTELHRNPRTLYSYGIPPSIAYPELDSEQCVGNIYVRLYLRHPEYDIADPEAFLLALIREMEEVPMTEDLMANLVRAQTCLYQKYNALPRFSRYPGFPVLHDKAIKTGITGDLVVAGVELSSSILSLARTVDNVNNWKQARGLEVVAQRMETPPSLAEDEYIMFLSFCLHTLTNAAFADGTVLEALCQDFVVMYPFVALFERTAAHQHGEIVLRALQALQTLGPKVEVAEKLLRAGVIPHVLDLAVFLDISEATAPIVNTSVRVLSTLSAESAPISTWLCRSLTWGVANLVDKEDEFVVTVRTDVENPVVIWDSEMRNNLSSALTLALRESKTAGRFDENSFAISYPNIEREYVVDHVYIRVLVAQPDFAIPDPLLVANTLLLQLRDWSILPNAVEAKEHLMLAFEALIILFKSSTVSNRVNVERLRTLPAVFNRVVTTRVKPLALGMLAMLSALIKGPHAGELTMLSKPLLRLLHQRRELVCSDADILSAVFELVNAATLANSAWAGIVYDGGLALSVLRVAIERDHPNRELAISIVGNLSVDAECGNAFRDLMLHLLAKKFDKSLKEAQKKPHKFTNYYDTNRAEAYIVWNDGTRHEFQQLVEREMGTMFEFLDRHDSDDQQFVWNYSGIMDRYDRPTLRNELQVMGVFIRYFNDNLYAKLHNTQRFFEQLFAILDSEAHEYERLVRSGASTDALAVVGNNITLLLDAIFIVLKRDKSLQSSHVCVHSVPLFSRLLAEFMPPEIHERSLKVLAILGSFPDFVRGFLDGHYLPQLATGLSRSLSVAKAVLGIIQEMLSQSDVFVLAIAPSGLPVYLLHIIMTSSDVELQNAAAALILLSIAKQPSGDTPVSDFLFSILPPYFAEEAVDSSAEFFVEYIHSDHKSVEEDWQDRQRYLLKEWLNSQVTKLQASAAQSWNGSMRVSAEDMHNIHTVLCPPPSPVLAVAAAENAGEVVDGAEAASSSSSSPAAAAADSGAGSVERAAPSPPPMPVTTATSPAVAQAMAAAAAAASPSSAPASS